MFIILEAKHEVAEAQRELEATIRRDFNRSVVKNIGYPGGTTRARVDTNGIYWFWSKDRKDSNTPNPRRLNWFGLFQDMPVCRSPLRSMSLTKAAATKSQDSLLETATQARSTSCIQVGLVEAEKELAKSPSSHGATYGP
jgi:hypothetical protein